MVCVAATFALIFVGGLVTSTGSALAVPDWPLAFGHLIPKLVGGVRFEYGHRVVAGIVTILTLVLAAWTWRVEPRGWVRKAAWAAFALIIIQAVLGGITVLLQLPLPIAVAHAATAQAFFCVVVALAAFTNPDLIHREPVGTEYGRPKLATLTSLTIAVIYVQILIGAVMRHLGAGLAIPDFPLSYGRLIPSFTSPFVAINFAHRCGAVVVTVFVVWTVARILRFHGFDSHLRRPALALLALLALQITLGASTIWSGRAVLPTTAHVAVGAAVLGTSVVLAIRSFASRGLAAVQEPARVPAPMVQNLEHQVSA